MSFAGSFAVLVIIFGGLKYITSVGNPDEVSDAKRIIKYALMGLVVCGLSYAIVKVISDTILK